MTWPGLEPGPPRLEAGDCLSYGTAFTDNRLQEIFRRFLNPSGRLLE
jgi:hypothetical protein